MVPLFLHLLHLLLLHLLFRRLWNDAGMMWEGGDVGELSCVGVVDDFFCLDMIQICLI